MEDARGLDKLDYFQLHKSVGITVLALSLIRLGWRLGHAWPPFPAAMPRWERVLARGTHILFYVLMIGVPLLGWAAASAGEAPPVPLYGVVPAPNLPVPLSHGLSETLGRSEEHTSELQSLMRISYAVFCLKKKHLGTKYIYH